ncbi:MAG: bifunctional methylenetetrahydrofolate dehydrogenase/methenyltetrahydrofolate cyclohydrolase FolD [Bryobacterales bacterium]|nr:bifunctional methylenetetrahydrofolate dehydrogenase/methenyltetrahydrofolate cyclohydrolase FolD [Bryobacterales bacterium]MDE0264704.1 bifunctional methylenetetrahydrofolate dehydrogenase/methenyltetrahydrofolate cyclohydrolase FolD [Bryobacterales bacterium]
MAARILDGNAIRDSVLAELASRVEQAARFGIRPGLAAVLVGEDPASKIYVRNKVRACDRIGAHSETLRMPAETTTQELLSVVEDLNAREEIDGILVQLPLPSHVDAQRVLGCIAPEKDVDGFHPVNVGKLASGQSCLAPCTPRGLIEILKRSRIQIKGRHAVVVGRSNIVGKPAALLLLAEHATVTICHSRTPDLPAVCRRAEILVAAAGRPAMLTREHIGDGAVVLDVGINRLQDAATVHRLFAHDARRLARFDKTGSTLVGDVHPGDVVQCASAYTPVPGGVGPLTIAMLMSNTLAAASRRAPADSPMRA